MSEWPRLGQVPILSLGENGNLHEIPQHTPVSNEGEQLLRKNFRCYSKKKKTEKKRKKKEKNGMKMMQAKEKIKFILGPMKSTDEY